jgi:hypothetical protein
MAGLLPTSVDARFFMEAKIFGIIQMTNNGATLA